MAYSKEDLIQCIYDCMEDSLPEDWSTAEMTIKISINNLDASFKYNTTSDDIQRQFKPQNFVAPMNAAKELQKMMTEEGDAWDAATIEIKNDGTYQISIF